MASKGGENGGGLMAARGHTYRLLSGLDCTTFSPKNAEGTIVGHVYSSKAVDATYRDKDNCPTSETA